MATTPRKSVVKFTRNQCVACNNVVDDQHHPVLVFGKVGSEEDISGKFDYVTGMQLKENDEFPKKICVPCKNKLLSAVNFKLLCVSSRKDQELVLKERVKRGRNSGESPDAKRVSPAANDTQQHHTGSRAQNSRYRPIFPKIAAERPTKDEKDVPVLKKYGCSNPKVSRKYLLGKLLQCTLKQCRRMFTCKKTSVVCTQAN